MADGDAAPGVSGNTGLNDGLTLTGLANEFHSDKGTLHPEPHSYTLFYDMLLYPRRASLRRMMEIGLCAGGPEVGGDVERIVNQAPSVNMWLRYFPNAMVHGFDISDFSFLQHPRFTFTRGDSGVEADLQRAVEGVDQFDLVIDDGSHASFHQQLALKVMFPKLAPGGLYIIEDLQWQSPYYEDQLPPTVKTAHLVNHWYATGEFPEITAPELSGLADIAREISWGFVLNHPFKNSTTPKIAVLQKKFRPA